MPILCSMFICLEVDFPPLVFSTRDLQLRLSADVGARMIWPMLSPVEGAVLTQRLTKFCFFDLTSSISGTHCSWLEGVLEGPSFALGHAKCALGRRSVRTAADGASRWAAGTTGEGEFKIPDIPVASGKLTFFYPAPPCIPFIFRGNL